MSDKENIMFIFQKFLCAMQVFRTNHRVLNFLFICMEIYRFNRLILTYAHLFVINVSKPYNSIFKEFIFSFKILSWHLYK